MTGKHTEFSFRYLKTSGLLRYKKLVRLLLPGSQDYTRFILLSSPRSGSTLLHTYLNSSVHIQSLGEAPWRDLENGIEKDYFDSYPYPIKAVGFKVFYQFAEESPYDKLYQELAREPSLKVIHLTRENKLEQYASHKLAWQKREWTRTGAELHSKRIIVDLRDFEKYIHDQERMSERCVEDFSQQSILNVSYESLTNNAPLTLNEIQDHLGTPRRKLFTLLEKQRTKPIEEVVENLEEVKSSFPHYMGST